MTEFILIEKSEGVVILTLNRPDAANALSRKMLHQLNEQLKVLRYDPTVRTIVITGAGEKVFCAGADLKERASMIEVEVKQTVSLIGDTINEVESMPQPVIAALNGAAFGGGLELALACDIRIAAEHSKVGLTETSLAIIPGAGGTQRLPRLIGIGKAKELIYTARRIEAKEALQLGIVEDVVSSNELLEKAVALAKEISKNGPIAVKQAKLAINKGLEVDLQTGLQIEKMAYQMTIPTKDRIEGLHAFKDKRKPVYKGE